MAKVDQSSLTNNKSEARLRNSSHQFMHLADKLLGAMKVKENEVASAMEEAKGFNIVSSKSTKVLPIASGNTGAQSALKGKAGKYITDQS